MTQKTITAEVGAPGTVLATGGNYGGSNIDLVSKTGTGNLVLSNTAGKAGRGTQSIRITGPASTDTALVRLLTGGTSTTMFADFAFSPDTTPTANYVVGTLRHASGTVVSIQHLATTGKIRVSDTVAAMPSDSPGAFPINTTAGRIAVFADRIANVLKVRVYDSYDSTNVLWSQDFTTGVNLGTNDFVGGQFGKIGTGYTQNMYLDAVRIDDAATDILAPMAVNQPPTITPGPAQTNVEPQSTVLLTASASDPDMTTPTITWAQTAGTPAVTLTPTANYGEASFKAPLTAAGTTLTFTATADDGSTTATGTTTVTVLAATEFIAIGSSWVPARMRTL